MRVRKSVGPEVQRTINSRLCARVIFLQGAVIAAPYDNEFNGFLNRMSLALLSSPPVVSVILLIRWAIQRRWRLITSWLVKLVIITNLIAACDFIVSIRSRPLANNESFDWTGWYLVLAPGAYFTSWIMIFTLAVGALGRWLFGGQRLRKKAKLPLQAEVR
jgi:hypothetical protein